MPKKTKDIEELKDLKTTKKTTVKSSNKKSSSKSSTKKDVKTKATSKSTKKTTAKKTTKKTPVSKKEKTIEKVIEYYDIPYRYNDTIVKILYQTPTKLFVYWDISDNQRELYLKEFGENFFNSTKPVLIVHNETKNYSFEVEVNDFANSWYLNIPDSKCNYTIELGRKSKNISEYYIPNNYIHVASSNKIESPNDHILFEKDQKMVYFRNIKTNVVSSKNVSTFSFINNIGKIYNIYEQYKEMYNENDEILNNNPSSLFKQ